MSRVAAAVAADTAFEVMRAQSFVMCGSATRVHALARSGTTARRPARGEAASSVAAWAPRRWSGRALAAWLPRAGLPA